MRQARCAAGTRGNRACQQIQQAHALVILKHGLAVTARLLAADAVRLDRCSLRTQRCIGGRQLKQVGLRHAQRQHRVILEFAADSKVARGAHQRAWTDFLGQPSGHHVAGLCEGLAQGDCAGVGFAMVARGPVAYGDGRERPLRRRAGRVRLACSAVIAPLPTIACRTTLVRLRALQVVGRRQGGGRLDHAGQHCRLGEVQLFRGSIEVVARGGAQPLDTVTEVDAAEIARQDFVLVESRFQPQCDQRFLRLAPEGAVRRQE